jgi:hypothetical protein
MKAKDFENQFEQNVDITQSLDLTKTKRVLQAKTLSVKHASFPTMNNVTQMTQTPPAQSNNPLHGITLEHIVVRLADHYGWEKLGDRININCFKNDPSVKSSLKFLRKTPWAREQVENLYLATF